MSRKNNSKQVLRAKQNQGEPKRSVNSLQQISEHFSGPIPHPELLEKYDNVLPGAAERILSMAEKNTLHQIEIDKKIVEGKLRELSAGQKMGFCIAIMALAASVICSWLGDYRTASIIGGTTIIGLVTAFLTVRLKSE